VSRNGLFRDIYLPIQVHRSKPLPAEGTIGKFHKAPLLRYVPLVFLTTVAVVVVPFVTVAVLRADGVISGVLPLAGAGLAISFAISALGSTLWKASPASGDLLFGDLLIWGFVRRWMVDRRLSSAAGLLGLRGDRKKAKLSRERQTELLERLGNSLESRDPYTHGHSRRVARHAATMAKRMGLPKHEVARIRTAAAIHDVGKVKTPAEALSKPGKLSDKEYAVIKRHPVDGARMAERLRDPKLTKMVLHHHERLDGGGYPRGLRGERIPLGARIIAVADTFDAITSARPYRPAKAHRQGLDVLQAESGTQLDPEAVEAFRSYYSGMKPVAIWAVLVNIPQRFLTGVFDELGASVASVSKTAVATAATVVAGSAAVYAAGFSAGPAAGPVAAQAATGADRGVLSASAGLPGFEHQVDESKSLHGDGQAPVATMAKLDERGGRGAGAGSVAGSGSGGGPAHSTVQRESGGRSFGGATSADEGKSDDGGGAAGGGGNAGGSPSQGGTGSGNGGGAGSDNPSTGDGNPGGGSDTSHSGGSGSDNPNAHGGNPNAGGGNAGGGGSGNPDSGGGNPNAGGGNSQGSSTGSTSESSDSFDSSGAAGGGGSPGNPGEAPGHTNH
jgi:putative nucleotidyltransferase with HDIG domain